MLFRLISFLTVVWLLISPPAAHLEELPPAFYPTWKLMSFAEKQQFVAGYIHGWRDAARVTDIVITYVKDNPGKAVEGLEQVRGLYDLRDLKPTILAQALDTFFEDPENKTAGLSQAVSAAKRAISGR